MRFIFVSLLTAVESRFFSKSRPVNCRFVGFREPQGSHFFCVLGSLQDGTAKVIQCQASSLNFVSGKHTFLQRFDLVQKDTFSERFLLAFHFGDKR